MATESKKLQTYMRDNGDLGLAGDSVDLILAAGHDARIAHEQREVIRKVCLLLDAIKGASEDGELNGEVGWTVDELLDGITKHADEALASAAPFLED